MERTTSECTQSGEWKYNPLPKSLDGSLVLWTQQPIFDFIHPQSMKYEVAFRHDNPSVAVPCYWKEKRLGSLALLVQGSSSEWSKWWINQKIDETTGLGILKMIPLNVRTAFSGEDEGFTRMKWEWVSKHQQTKTLLRTFYYRCFDRHASYCKA